MIDTVLYLIRHKSTDEIMPLLRNGRGYSHWNPGNPNADKLTAHIIGWRFLASGKQANNIISLWVSQPNLYIKYDYNGESNLDIKDDGRKKEDLEVITVRIQEITR